MAEERWTKMPDGPLREFWRQVASGEREAPIRRRRSGPARKPELVHVDAPLPGAGRPQENDRANRTRKAGSKARAGMLAVRRIPKNVDVVFHTTLKLLFLALVVYLVRLRWQLWIAERQRARQEAETASSYQAPLWQDELANLLWRYQR